MKQDTASSDYPMDQRSSAKDVQRDFTLLLRSDTAKALNAVPSPVLVLNSCRQLVYANKALRNYLQLDAMDDALGQRPGELFDCTHAKTGTDGCGTSEFCKDCGAVKAILSSICGKEDTQECRLLREVQGEITALDLLVHAVPYDAGGKLFTVFTIHDVSHEKRRRYLERIFFHDIINSAGGALGLAELLFEEAETPNRYELKLILQSLTHLLDEIESQKTLLAAETNELVPRPVPTVSTNMLQQMLDKFFYHRAAQEKTLTIGHVDEVRFSCDQALLGRVLGNMIKNALEATPEGGTVTLSCKADDLRVRFHVHNEGCMPPEIQRQIFKRSFSSKGPDRGLGTFSIRLLTQNLLGGRASFRSTEAEGTTFSVELPLSPRS